MIKQIICKLALAYRDHPPEEGITSDNGGGALSHAMTKTVSNKCVQLAKVRLRELEAGFIKKKHGLAHQLLISERVCANCADGLFSTLVLSLITFSLPVPNCVAEKQSYQVTQSFLQPGSVKSSPPVLPNSQQLAEVTGQLERLHGTLLMNCLFGIMIYHSIMQYMVEVDHSQWLLQYQRSK